MQMTLRHLADDVIERFARLRMRHHTSGDDSTKRRRRSKAASQSSAVDDDDDVGRRATPDLIRPHVVDVVAGRTASLPPLPPTPASSSDKPRRRRRTSAYLSPSSSAVAMGHIYEEIPPTTPPPPRHRRGGGSTSSCVDGAAEVVGRVYYVSPLDGALCRIFPVDERAVHRRQLACAHVRRRPTVGDDRPPSPPLDVVAVVAASGLSALRGRELRLCAACCRQLRSSLAGDETAVRDCRRRSSAGTASPSLSSSFYNSCDLGLLNVPCCYSSEAGDVDNDDDDDVSRSERQCSGDRDAQPALRDGAVRDSVSGDVIDDVTAVSTSRTPKFGEPGSAFTKFDGGRRARADEGSPRRWTNGENVSCGDGRRVQRPCRVVTDPSFDVRRRPLRDADDAVLAVLDSAPDGGGFRSRCDDAGRRINGAKSTSCADVRWARRRSLALRRRSDDDGRRRRAAPATTSGGEATSGGGGGGSCRSGSESSLQGRAAVRSVYYNGLLASMIDLTATFDRASADDRLSCRATSGPRRSLRPSRQSPSSSSSSSGLCPRDGFASSVRHSSGDLMLRSVQ